MKTFVSIRQHYKNAKKIAALSFTITILLSATTSIQSVYAVSFSFNSVQNLSSNGSNSITPEVAASGSNVYTVWRDGNAISFRRSIDSGSSFVAQTDIGNTAASAFAGTPKLAEVGNNVYAVWRDETAGNGDIQFRASTNNGASFNAILQLSSATNLLSSRTPQIASSSGNDVYVVWRESADILFRASSDNGATFVPDPATQGAIDLGNTGGALSPDPQIAASANNVYVVWQDGTDIKFARSTNNGASFSAAVDIGDSTSLASASSPKIAASGTNVYVVWQQNSDIKFASSINDGASFSAAVDIGDTGGATISLPQIAASVSSVYIVWRDNTPGNADIQFRRSTDNGATFLAAVNLSSNTEDSINPQIKASGIDVQVVWQDATPIGSNNDILFRASDDGGATFGGSTNLSENTSTSIVPKVAASGTGVYVVWQDGTTGDTLFRSGTPSSLDVSFDATQYKLSQTATVTVTDSSSSGSISVGVISTSDGTGITLTLFETGAGVFDGELTFTTGSSSGSTLKAAQGDTITASFSGETGTASIFPRQVSFTGVASFDRGSIAHITVTDQNSNLNVGSAETISVTVTTDADPSGETLVLTETGPDTGIFGGISGTDLIFMVGDDLLPTVGTVTITQEDTVANSNPSAIETTTVTVSSTSDPCPCPPGGIILTVTETGINTGIFSAQLKLGPQTIAGEQIEVAGGDFLSITHGSLTSRALIVPNPNAANGAIQVDVPIDTVTATYQGVSASASVLNAAGESGGGAGGLVRPGLVLNLLAAGGGGNNSPPSLTLTSALSKSLLPELLKAAMETADPFKPIPASTDPSLELPLTIDGKGFALTSYSNTIVTNTLATQEPVHLKLIMYEGTSIDHLSLYTNLRGTEREIQNSDTYIIYNKGKPVEVVDPHDLFSDVKFTLSNNRPKFVADYEITFAKPLEKSDIIIRAWDDMRSSSNVKIFNAWEIVESNTPAPPASSLLENEKQVQETAESLQIPIWIKSNANWWSEGQISDDDFVQGIQYLIEQKIMKIPETDAGLTSSQQIPAWIKNNADWWSDGLITDNDFVQGIQWLITNGIMKI